MALTVAFWNLFFYHWNYLIPWPTSSHSYSTYGPVSLPETFGEMGTAKITLMPDAGVEGVESERSPRDLFTPDGVRVLKDAMPEDISRLPKGIYIMGNRKIIVR